MNNNRKDYPASSKGVLPLSIVNRCNLQIKLGTTKKHDKLSPTHNRTVEI